MYAELHCKTNFSFLQGASHPDELVVQAAELGYAALAITDRNSLAGVVRAHGAAKAAGLKLLVGAEITPINAPPIVLLATDRAAYGRLARLITVGRRNAEKGACRLTLDDVAGHAEGLIAAVVPADPLPQDDPAPRAAAKQPASRDDASVKQRASDGTRGKSGEVGHADLVSMLIRLHEIFPQRCHLLAELHYGPDDERRLEELMRLARRSGVPLVAGGDVHYHAPRRCALHDVLTAIRLGCTVREIGEHRFSNAQRHLRPIDQIAHRYARCPEALRRAVHIAQRCTFSLDELRYEYPHELAPAGLAPLEYLKQLAWQGARQRYPGGLPDKVRRLVEHELVLIEELRYEAYFLTVWDLVRFARSRGILCQGRGSAANSAVCYLLGITSVDPERIDILFERFVSRERNEAPDIDVDFEHERREEVLQYVYEKYGRERAGIAAEVITYRPRSAVRDVGKALGLSLDRVDALAKSLDSYAEPKLEPRCRDAGLDPGAPLVRQLVGLVGELVGFPRHLSQHVGGMVITRGPLCELVPIENAAMPDRTVIQWNKDDLDELGILKVDCLSLGMLTAIRKCFELVERHTGRRLTLAGIPAEDPAVYDMICRADTVGVFQIESRAQMSMLPRLRPRTFYDLVIEVAIVRPGPIQGEMVHPYLRRRGGQEPVTYPNDAIREVLEKTLGVPLFQEQAMRLAVVAAGFTPGEADELRRAMAAWRRPGVIQQFQERLLRGMIERGLPLRFAEQVFQQIRGFGEYGFPESHAASFALLVYVSAWLKHYCPAAFTAALLNSQPMGFYAPAQLVRDARDHGVAVLPVDVNASQWDCTLEPVPARAPHAVDAQPEKNEPALAAAPSAATTDESGRSVAGGGDLGWSDLALRLGLRQVLGLPRAAAEQIVQQRCRGGAYRWLDEFVLRTRLGRPVVSRLAEADAFGSLGLDRRRALWHALAQDPRGRRLPLFDHADRGADEQEPVDLPAMHPQHEVAADYRTVRLSLRDHPMSFFRAEMDALGVTPAAGLARQPDGGKVRVAGLVLLRQRPSTAKGITFVTLEDETGTVNLVIHFGTWERFHRVARSAAGMLVRGRLESRDGVIHVIAERIEDLTGRLHRLRVESREFR